MNEVLSFIHYFLSVLKNHLKQWEFYLLIFLLIGFSFLNHVTNFEYRFLDHYSNHYFGFLFFFMFYGFAYLIGFLFLKKKTLPLQFWLFIIIIFILLSISSSYTYISYLLKNLSNNENQYILRKIFVNSRNIFIIGVPSIILWKKLKADNEHFFWLSFKKKHFPLYLTSCVLIIIITLIVSRFESFYSYYPTFKANYAHAWLSIPVIYWNILYELVYLFDFLWIELIFRGILIIGFYHFLGKDTLLPMISLYCFFHFGKPLGEVISSIFGGYIIGVLSLYTHSITGGTIIHIVLAFSIDIFASF